MRIVQKQYTPTFQANTRTYKGSNGDLIGTMTSMFREDLQWDNTTKYIIENFKNKNNVNIIQFASSDGSEAYTQIINFLELLNPVETKKFFPIQAYDIDEKIVQAAKSKLLNLTCLDIRRVINNSQNFDRYFSESHKILKIPNDSLSYVTYNDKKNFDNAAFKHKTTKLKKSLLSTYKTYDVSSILTNKANFKTGDMFNILNNYTDDSNSVVICRNILGYFSERKIKYFIDIAKQKLKKDSLLIIGSLDTSMTNIEKLLQQNDFQYIMKNVYKKL